MAAVTMENLHKSYEKFVAVNNINLDVRDGEFLVLLGPSGCGKTTTLRMLGGFVEPDGGRLTIGGRDVTREPPYRRNIGLVFQNYALFPHLSIFENVAFGLRRRKLPEADIRIRVGDALELVRLAHLRDRFPVQLSGGQQQRVAIARALAIRPDVLLLDEPLSNLDARLRLEVRDELRALQQTLKITTIMVTHDQDEAMYIGDRLVVMNQGAIQQIGSASEIYNTPSNRFVASFIGRTNFLEGYLAPGEEVFRTASGLAVRTLADVKPHAELMIRPDSIEISPTPARDENCFEASIANMTFLGGHYEIVATLAGGEKLAIVASAKAVKESGVLTETGRQLYVSFAKDAAILM